MTSYVDYTFYSETYKGTQTEEAFNKEVLSASKIIDSLTFQKIDAENIIDEIKYCCCEILDLGTINTVTPTNRAIAPLNSKKSEKIGDYQVVYNVDSSSGGSTATTVQQNTNAMYVNIVHKWLTGTMYLYRGVY